MKVVRNLPVEEETPSSSSRSGFCKLVSAAVAHDVVTDKDATKSRATTTGECNLHRLRFSIMSIRRLHGHTVSCDG